MLRGILFNYVQVDIKNHRSRGARFNILLFDDSQGDINAFKNSLNYLISLIKNCSFHFKEISKSKCVLIMQMVDISTVNLVFKSFLKSKPTIMGDSYRSIVLGTIRKKDCIKVKIKFENNNSDYTIYSIEYDLEFKLGNNVVIEEYANNSLKVREVKNIIDLDDSIKNKFDYTINLISKLCK